MPPIPVKGLLSAPLYYQLGTRRIKPTHEHNPCTVKDSVSTINKRDERRSLIPSWKLTSAVNYSFGSVSPLQRLRDLVARICRAGASIIRFLNIMSALDEAFVGLTVSRHDLVLQCEWTGSCVNFWRAKCQYYEEHGSQYLGCEC